MGEGQSPLNGHHPYVTFGVLNITLLDGYNQCQVPKG